MNQNEFSVIQSNAAGNSPKRNTSLHLKTIPGNHFCLLCFLLWSYSTSSTMKRFLHSLSAFHLLFIIPALQLIDHSAYCGIYTRNEVTCFTVLGRLQFTSWTPTRTDLVGRPFYSYTLFYILRSILHSILHSTLFYTLHSVLHCDAQLRTIANPKRELSMAKTVH